jgi:HEAT repeat protein
VIRTRLIAFAAAAVLLTCVGLRALEPIDAAPSFGSWQGFPPGSYIIEKRTYRGAKYHADGVEYRRTVLVGVTESGAARYQDYISETAGGPWKINLAHGDVAPGNNGKRLESKSLPEETLLVKARRFECSVTETVQTDDWGQLTTKQWTDKVSGMVLREEVQYEGRTSKGEPSRWRSKLVTVAMEKRSVGQESFECFVQEREQSLGNENAWWRTWATPKVPERRAAMIMGHKKDAPPESEIELVEWGRDVSLLDGIKKESPLFASDRRQKEEQERTRQSEARLKEMVADLASAEPARILSGISAVSQWADLLSPAIKAEAIEALKKALNHPAAEVRRASGKALGQLGVRGLSARLTEMLRSDPAGLDQYLEALGIQADSGAFAAIVPSLSDPKEMHRHAAVAALRFFKDNAARAAAEKALGDDSSLVRLRAVESLEKMADPQSVRALLRALHDSDSIVVSAAIRVIATIGDDFAVPALLDLLRNGSNEVRSTVSIYLGKLRLKQPDVVGDALLPLIGDPDARLSSAAISSLGAIREKRAVPELVKLLEGPTDPKPTEPWVLPRAMAIVTLGRIGDPAAIGPLVKLLDSPESNERALEALVSIGDSSAAKPLFSHYVRTASAGNLSRFHSKEIEALGKLGPAEIRGELETYLARCPPPQKKKIREAINAIDQRLPR